MRRAATLYWENESMSLFRIFDASASWAGDGGLSGSLVLLLALHDSKDKGTYCKAIRSRWNFGSINRIPRSN